MTKVRRAVTLALAAYPMVKTARGRFSLVSSRVPVAKFYVDYLPYSSDCSVDMRPS